MLNSLRSLAGAFAAKILLVLLVLTFVVWGIGDILRSPSSSLAVATVGGSKISRDSFVRELNMKSEAIRQMMGDRYSPEVMKSMNITQQVLFQLINQKLFQMESEALGLIPADADVVRQIRNNPHFKDEKGNFDKGIFESVLRNSNISEKAYVDQMREDMGANLLRDALAASVPVPDSAVSTLLGIRDEQRKITLYTLSSTQVGEMPQPDVAQLKAYYDAHSREFTAPEVRTVSYVTISAADVKENPAAVEDELRAAYKDRIEEFKHPERRTVEQLLYDSKENADKAEALLKSGKSFAQVAKSTPIINKDTLSMGKVEHSKLFEGAADKVFALKKDEYSDPIQSPFGWHVFHVTAIDAPATDSFEEARPALEKDAKQHGADEGLNTLMGKFEDALAGGTTLAEAAHDFGLKVQAVGPFNKEGNAPDGRKVTIPTFEKFVDTAFKLEEKSDSQPLTASAGSYYIMHVDTVTPERLRTLDEIRDVAAAGWQRQERDKRLHAMAKEVSDKFAKPADRAALIAQYKLNATPVTLRRDSQKAGDTPLLPQLVLEVFSHKAQESTTVYPTPSGSYILAVVDSVIPVGAPEKDAKLQTAMAEIRTHLQSSYQNEVLDQYTHYLAKKYSVSVDQAVLQSVIQ